MTEPAAAVGRPVRVEIWSDVVCPWCYVGKRRFEAALARFAHRDDVAVRWRSFELDPSAPAVRDGSYVSRLAAKYRVSPAEAQAMIDRITGAAAGVGLRMRFDIARPGRSFDAHRLIHLGAHRGRQDAVKERLLAATFVEGEAIGEPATLARLAVEAGLDGDEVRSVLETDAFADGVRADQRQAAELGITAVPFFVVDRRLGISGAQPPEALGQLLQRGWDDTRHPVTPERR